MKKILILGCGINSKDIFCTSIDGLGIKTGEDFREYIKSTLIISYYSFLFISKNYKQSEICLNEMGASWAHEKINVKPFLLPSLNFESLGLLYSVKQAAKLNDPSRLDELYEELITQTKIETTVTRWNKYKKDFLEFLSLYEKEQANSITPNPEEYFSQFIKENASLNHILLKAHPTLLDCKAIFADKFYRGFFIRCCEIFEKLDKEVLEPLYPKKKYFRIVRTTPMEMLQGINTIAGGLVEAAKQGYFNYGIELYRVTFLENENSKDGNSFKVFCYVNGRWVFIPRPYASIQNSTRKS